MFNFKISEMKKAFIICFILQLTVCLKGQQITDSTLIMCQVQNGIDGASLGKSFIQYCMLSLDINVDNGTILIVSGYKHCDDESILQKKADYLEVMYKGEEYYVSPESVKFAEDIDYISLLKKMDSEQYERFKKHAKYLGEIYHDGKITEIHDFLKSCKPKGLSVLNFSIFDESEYTDGTSAKVEVWNPTSKIIKYIWFNLVGYNSVDDVVYKSGKPTVTVRAIGPIEPQSSSAYTFNYVWFTDLVQRAKISSITVKFMDGTINTIKNEKAIELSKEQYKYIKQE